MLCHLAEFLHAVTAKAKKVIDCAASHGSTKGFRKDLDRSMYTANIQRIDAVEKALIRVNEILGDTQMVTCGSSLMYTTDGFLLINEESHMNPSSGYGYAKAVARKKCEALRHMGIKANMAILFNHDSIRRGPGYFLPRAIKALLRYRQYGEVQCFGDLNRQIDVGSAEDVAKALVMMSKCKDMSSDYVVGSGRLHPLKDLVDYAGMRVGIENASAVIGSNEEERTQSGALLGDTRKIGKDLGWMPRKDIWKVIDEMVDSYTKGSRFFCGEEDTSSL